MDREYLPGTMGEDTLLERKEHEEDIIDKLVRSASDAHDCQFLKRGVLVATALAQQGSL